QLESVSAMAVLARGYALVLDGAGHAVTSAADVAPGVRLRLRFADGSVGVKADGARPGQGVLPI
ncbi:MAG: exodeoxyribonuclease VII large subunit, partial [Gemmatimonadaceae bacterium]|nr:exodeoxyribonuclease VII large subunit [Acetobacteraceae bacterium]